MARIDPLACIFARGGQLEGKTWCAQHETWTECQVGHWGEPPMCAWDEPDNSPEACERRRAFLRAEKDKNG